MDRRLSGREPWRVVTADRAELDLTDPRSVLEFLNREKPEAVIIAAGRVGGIRANAEYPGEFIYENLMIETNLIHGAWRAGVQRLLNFGSSCMYPKDCPQPMRPEFLMTGGMEPTSEPYAVAKWAGFSLCGAYNRQYGTRYRTAIPCTVYGPGDNFDPETGHVLSALLGRLHQVKEENRPTVVLWGSGKPRREFLYADDLAEACEVLLESHEGKEPVNIGSSEAVSIRDLANLAAEVVGYRGRITWDLSKPDGAPRKEMDSSVIRSLGWKPRTALRDGLAATYRWFLENEGKAGRSCVS